MSFTAGGTSRWMSPELLDPERFGASDDRPTKESDCYALGMVIYEVRPDANVPSSERSDLRSVRCFWGNHPTGTSRIKRC